MTSNDKKEKLETKNKKQGSGFSGKMMLFWTGIIVLIIFVGIYFSPLKNRIENFYTTTIKMSQSHNASNGLKSIEPQLQKREIDQPKNAMSHQKSALKTFELDEFEKQLDKEIKQLRVFVKSTVLYSFIINDLMTQLSESDPIKMPEKMINLLPTTLAYHLNKLFLDAEIKDGASALNVYQLNDELQKNFVAWSNLGKKFNATRYFDKFWLNVKSWVKIKKIESEKIVETKGKTTEKQLSTIQKYLLKYDFVSVKKIFTQLPQNVQEDMSVWHDNLLMREKFFKLKSELDQIILDFFKSDMNQIQKNHVIEYDIQPKSKSE